MKPERSPQSGKEVKHEDHSYSDPHGGTVSIYRQLSKDETFQPSRSPNDFRSNEQEIMLVPVIRNQRK